MVHLTSKLDKTRLNIFLTDRDADEAVFHCFSDIAEKNGGFIESWQTPEQLKEKYGLNITLANVSPNEPINPNVINYVYFMDAGRSVERCKVSLNASMPYMLDGLERIMIRNDPEETCKFLTILADITKETKIPILIPVNKQLYKRDLEIYMNRYVVEHDITN